MVQTEMGVKANYYYAPYIPLAVMTNMNTQYQLTNDHGVWQIMVTWVGADQLLELEKWCKEMFGDGGRHHRYRWRKGWTSGKIGAFYFKQQKDAMFFLLKWQ